jgi:hypothetical protein
MSGFDLSQYITQPAAQSPGSAPSPSFDVSQYVSTPNIDPVTAGDFAAMSRPLPATLQPTMSPPASTAPAAAPAQTPTVKPSDVALTDYTIPTLKKAAAAAGVDTAHLSDDYFADVAHRYQAASEPGMMNYLKSTGVGHFLQGVTEAGRIDPDGLAKRDPGLAAHLKADDFFNKNIQTRIIDKGANIDAHGEYTAPTTEAAGELVGNPWNVVGIGGLRYGYRAYKLLAPIIKGAAYAWGAYEGAKKVAGKVEEAEQQ